MTSSGDSSAGGDSGLDRLLDRTLLLGYSAVGPAVRSRHWRSNDPARGSLAGRNALVTGGGGGLGEAIALGLARLGANVYIAVRSVERGAAAAERISSRLAGQKDAGEVFIEACDVSSFASIDCFCARLGARLEEQNRALDVVIHNAGVMPKERTVSVDRHELSLATHVLGPVRMTEVLRPALARSASGGRVVFVASGGMYAQSLEVDDIEYERDAYHGATAYARSKRLQVEIVPQLEERWRSDGISVYSMHPGWVDTPGIAESLPRFRALLRVALRSAESGADTAVWLAATEPRPAGGGFWHDRKERPTSYFGANRSTEDQLQEAWRWVEQTLRLG